ncbi:MAG TPA: hypothetical protein ENH62_05305, partial [Marinobacter sp.]|nr:hypothetical protein [Marinobacter sp.]
MAVIAEAIFVSGSTARDFDPDVHNGNVFTVTGGVAGDAFTPTGVTVRMSSTTSHSGTVNIYAADGSDEPTGNSLASMTFPATNFGAEGPQIFTFTSATTGSMVFGGSYCFIVTADVASNDLKTHASITLLVIGDRIHSTDFVAWTHTLNFTTYFEMRGDLVSAADFTPSDVKYTRKLVTFSANKVFTGSTPAAMTELTAADGDIDTGQPLSATEAYGKVFVANGPNLKVADFINVKITTASLGSSANAPNHGNILTGGTSSAKMSVDYINANTGATTLYGSSLTTASFSSGETVTGTNTAGNAVSFVTNSAEATGPFWYDWTVYANDTTTYGTLPDEADLVELHIGRVWVNNGQSPHQWHASRQNNPWDWKFGIDDVGSSVKGNDTDAGEVGDILIDMISYSDDYMVMGGSGSLYVMIGNPTAGGELNKLRNTGLLAARAWDWDDEGNLFMVSTEGLLIIPRGFGPAQNLTSKTYPDWIKDIAYDPTIHRIIVKYDPENFGVLISKVTTADGTNTVWWYDMRTGGIFIDEYPEEASFFSMWRFEADDPANSGLLFGCNDGYVRRYDSAQKSDDIGATDEAIDAQVGFGPFKTMEAVRKAGRVSNIDVELGGANDNASDDSDDVTIKVYAADNPDKVVKDMTT